MVLQILWFKYDIIKQHKDIKADNVCQEGIILANERIDSNWKSENYKIKNSTFAKMGFLKSHFSNDDLRFNVYIDCYFKRAKFDRDALSV